MMDKSDYYKYYQSNIEFLDSEIAQVKKAAQTAIGKKTWEEKSETDPKQIAATEKEIRACTRLYTFLICSWFEACLMKILYENSSVAFSETDITLIRNLKSMDMKWKTCFSIAVCKSYGFSYSGDIDHGSNFLTGSIEQQNYWDVYSLFVDISDAITIRNRLAHGQWEVQFNSSNTKVANYSFLTNYNNIQKLDILKQCYNHIADIISSYVTYKDKKDFKFNQGIREKIRLILNKKIRIHNSDYQKYASQLGRCYESQRNRYTKPAID